MHLYETHLPVADTNTAQEFYTTIVGLPFAYRDPTRDIVFMWADAKEKAMLGLWGPNSLWQTGSIVAKASSRVCRFPGRTLYRNEKTGRTQDRHLGTWR